MQNTLVYIHNNTIYVNLTNKCNNNCVFCIRNRNPGIGQDNLWFDKYDYKPSLKDIKPDLNNFFENQELSFEVVFCGYGESTYCVDTMIQVAHYCHINNKKTRLNSNGLGASINNITNVQLVEKLVGYIDSVSISLNASNSIDYDTLSKPNIDNAFSQVLEFGIECKKRGINTVFTAVDILNDRQIQELEDLCASLNIELKIRKYIR